MAFTTDMVIYLLGVAVMAGTILARIAALEKKVEKHNEVIVRTYKLEEKVDNLEEEIKEVRK